MENRQKFYENCRKIYPIFTYEGYTYSNLDDRLDITYNFSIDGLSEFHPTWSIKKASITLINQDKLEELIFSLGMVELISYWKIACPPKVIIKPRILDFQQINWWKKLYYHGLGEFYYTNSITESFDDFLDITCDPTAPVTKLPGVPLQKGLSEKPAVLIPVGGGKDSAVSIELLKDKATCFTYIINPRGATVHTVEKAGLEAYNIIAKRTLDKNMLDLNAKGFLNGHTPFSAIVAFSSVLAAMINGIEYIALSNESSANESTVAGSYVNHQYSKSFEFEADFRSYEKKYINSGCDYFSLLRPLAEIQIAMLFSRYKKYHDIFRSCNVGSKEDIWCGHCPKCLFVYIILSPFLSLEELDAIFGRRLFEDETLLEDFKKLCGDISEKPFECVGSRNEVNASLSETIKQYMIKGIVLPKLLLYYKDNHELNNLFDACIKSFEDENAVPEIFIDAVKEAINI